MSSGNNSCDFSGRLTREVELRYTPGGSAVCDFSVAVNSSYKNKDGEAIEKVTYVNFVAWEKIAEHVGQNYTKGTWIDVKDSEMNVEVWDDKQTGEKRYSTKYKLRRMPTSFLGGVDDSEAIEQPTKSSKATRKTPQAKVKVAAATKQFDTDEDDDDSDIPF